MSRNSHKSDPSMEEEALEMMRKAKIEPPVTSGHQHDYYDTEYQDPYPDSEERPLNLDHRHKGADKIVDRAHYELPKVPNHEVHYKLPQPPEVDEFAQFEAMAHFDGAMPTNHQVEPVESISRSPERSPLHHPHSHHHISPGDERRGSVGKASPGQLDNERRSSIGHRRGSRDFQRPLDTGILPTDVVPMTHAMDVYLDNKEEEERDRYKPTLGSPPGDVEERFLEMPGSDDYEKVRAFKLDEDGDLVNTKMGYVYRNKAESPSDPMPLTEDGIEKSADSSFSRYAVLLIGAPEVGKSSLIKQLQSCDSLDPGRLDSISEEDLKLPVLIDGREVDLVFTDCDVLENEKWELNMNFAAMLVMYAVTDEKSFIIALDILRQLREEYSEDIPIILVANKIDLERLRVVEIKDGNKLAKSYNNCKFIEISVQLGCETHELLKDLLLEMKKYEKESV